MPRALRSLSRSAFGRADILVSSVVINLLSLALPLVILQTYDRVIPNNANATFTYLLAGLVGVILIDGGLRLGRAYVTSWNAARFEHAIGCRTMARMLSSGSLDFERQSPGEQLARFNAVETLRDLYAGQGMLSLIDLPFVLIFLSMIGIIGGPLVAVPLLIIGIIGLLALVIGYRLGSALQERETFDDRRYSFIIEVLGGMQVVKGLALEALMLRRYERLLRSSSEAVYAVILKSGLAQATGAMFSNLTMVSVAVAGAVLVLDGRLTMGTLAACMLLSGRSVQPILRAIGVWVQFQNIKIAEERLQKTMATPLEMKATSSVVPTVTGSFRFEDVGFIYPEAEKPSFLNIDLQVTSGETMAIIGENGSGKSTFLGLTMGLLSPSAGVVRHEGVSVGDIDPFEIRKQIAYLPQRGTLYRGTIRDNLTMFDIEGRLDAAMEYAKALELDKVLARLPSGLDTELGNSSNDILAAGVRQRIAIVRALAIRPQLILFDEANSAFDLRTDECLRELFQSIKGTTTIVMVSHRPSLIGLADRKFMIKDCQLHAYEPEPASGRHSFVHQQSQVIPHQAVAQ